MLLIANPRATSVSARLKRLVAYALRARFEVEALETERRNHASELSRAAVAEGYDLVVAFGGDGTVNETANGLAGSQVPLSVLPGGCTNVVCRLLGIPTDVIDATEQLLLDADGLRTRAIDLGRVNDRYFVSSAGVGLDAETTRWVDERAPLKRRAGPYFFSYAGAVNFSRYLRRPVEVTVEAGGRRVEGVSAVLQNGDPYTFFKSRPVRICSGQELDSGELSLAVLKRARSRDVPTLAYRLLSARQTDRHRQIESMPSVRGALITGFPDGDGEPQPFPVQVDGDWIGDLTEARFAIEPGALRVVL